LDAAGKPKGKHAARFQRAIKSALGEHGGERAPVKMVQGYFINDAGPKETDDAKRKAWERELKKARESGLIETDSCGEFVWWATGETSE
jgi:hypothetical protein